MNQVEHNIVIVTSEFPPQPGGIGNHAFNLALHFSKSGYIVLVIADQRSIKGEEEAIFDLSLPFSVKRIKSYKWRFRMYIRRMILTYGSLKKTKHVIATGKFSLWNVAFCSLFHKCQTIAIIHGSEVNFKSYTIKKSVDIALKRFNKIIAVSNFTKRLISNLKKDVKVIPNGIDFLEWTNNNLPIIELDGSPVLTTVGRVSSRKGQLNVIKQLPELIKHFPELHYHCVGITTEADAFIKVANELNVKSHVTFHGSVDIFTLKQILFATDIFVMLSTEDHLGDVEGFGIAILEANALGIPAIGSLGCGIEDAIKTNVSGVLVNSISSTEFVKAIRSILRDKFNYSKGAKDWAKSHQWSDIIKLYITELE